MLIICHLNKKQRLKIRLRNFSKFQEKVTLCGNRNTDASVLKAKIGRRRAGAVIVVIYDKWFI